MTTLTLTFHTLALSALLARGQIISRPNRPTVSTSAETTQSGVLEVETGWTGESDRPGINGMMRYGLFPRLDLRWSADPAGHWLGTQWFIRDQSPGRPAFALSYAGKLPGGSAYPDHRIAAILSKHAETLSWNLNATYIAIGTDHGSDRNWELAAGFSRPIHGQLSLAGDFYVDTRQGPGDPAFASTLWAVTYSITPRLVVDASVDVGLTSHAPHRRTGFGVTYAVMDLNTILHRFTGAGR